MAGILPLAVASAGEPVRPYASLAITLPLGYQVAVTHDDERLYAAGSPQPLGGRTRLVAYRLADGSVEWEVPLSPPADGVAALRMVHGSLVFLLSGPTATGVTAFDPATGAELWRHRGWPIAAIEGRLLLRRTVTEVGTDPDSVDYQHAQLLTMVDAGTGHVVWQQSLPGSATAGDTDHPYVVTRDADQRLATYDLRSGALLATSSVSAGEGALQLVDSLVLGRTRNAPTLTAYSVRRLRPEWTVPIEADSWMVDCGPMICLHRSGRVEMLDVASGELAWSYEWQNAPGWLLYRLPHPSNRDVLVFEALGGRQRLFAATTGELLLDLAEWRLRQPQLRVLAPADPGDDVLVTRQEGDRSWLGRLRLDGPRVEVVGALDGALPSCALAAGHAVCLGDVGREAQIWRIQS